MHQVRDPVRPLLVGIGILGLLHHADHVLRADHSGWPFTTVTTPFTYSLSVYALCSPRSCYAPAPCLARRRWR